MNFSRLRVVTTGLLASALFGVVTSALAKPVASDLSAPEKRRLFVEQISRLAKPVKPAPLPSDLALPFSPPGFDQTDAQERDAKVATGSQGAPRQAASDRETLEQLAARIVPSGTMRDKSGEPLLTFNQKTVKKGAHFSVSLPPNAQVYDVELVRIDSTTFTLRFNREEITRPIKPAAKSP